jgi:hypothetical protein
VDGKHGIAIALGQLQFQIHVSAFVQRDALASRRHHVSV